MDLPVAPVVLLAYRRPEQTRRVFEAIRAAKPRDLFLVMDGPKPSDTDDYERVEQTRAVVEDVDWECNVRRVYASENLGLKVRVSSGLDAVFSDVESAIILEDDCLPSATFFPYASELLDRFSTNEKIGLISGSQRLRGRKLSDSSYEFSRDVRIWGWATWGRTWRNFRDSGDLNAQWTAQEARALGEYFAPGPRRRSMVSMMSKSTTLDSWALPFAVHCAKRGYLNPVPAVNLIDNIGLGEGSTHTGLESWVAQVPRADLAFPLIHPGTVEYGGRIDEMESSLDAKEFISFPLRHPFEVARRLWRFGLSLLRSRLTKLGAID
jgi:hypothetical protein